VREAADRGIPFIVIDPRRTDVAAIADEQSDGIWLRLNPGTNIPLVNSILHVIFGENLHNEEFIAARCDNFDHVREHVRDYSPEEMAEITGVSAELVRKAARLYAKSENAMILYGLGVAEHKGGTAGVMSLANLVLATGHVGRPCNGINPLRGQNNVQGACDMGTLPYTLPGYQATDDPEALEKFAKAWGVDSLPVTAGLLEPEMYEGALKGTFKGLYCVGYDPAHTQANINHVKEALQAMDFVVVQDMFLTETAKYAHVVFPAACFYEKDGTFSSGERRVRRIRKAVNAPGDAKPDWEIICLLAQAMGYPMFYTHPEHIMGELSKLTPPYRGISYKRLDEESSQTWPCPEENHPGIPLLHTESFPIGKGRFQAVSYVVPEEVADSDYPLTLITGRRREHYNNGSMTRRCKGFDIIAGSELVEINPDDAAALGISDGDQVNVESRRGKVRATARVTERSNRGNVFMTFHFDDTLTNILTSPGMDTKTMTPEYKVAAVRISGVK
jgi:predicted molibdopterin-dependent oxidoreductase YjgC